MDEIKIEQPKVQTRLIIPQEKYDLLVWTEHEKLFRERAAFRNKILAEILVPFTIALQVKLRRSLLGTYLEHMNENQWQNEFLNMNKLAVTDTVMENFSSKQWKKFEYNNNYLLDEVMDVLKRTVTESGKVDCRFIYERATFLRLDDYHINMVDDGLRSFKNLQVLVICGNWINDIYGVVLPRSLKFLELYVNEINSMENLAPKAPKRLEYLGLARNRLTNNSALHLLGEAERFLNLRTLDLGECDIYRLVNILESLKQLYQLEGLCLQGNPCSMVMGYKDIVLSYFPYLIFLDGVEILKEDRKLSDEFMNGSENAELILMCSKLTGLPKPPKADKQVKQTIHIEFVMPLFQESTIEDVEADESDKDDDDQKKKGGKGKSGKKDKKDKKKTKGSKKGKGSKKSSKKSPYEKENEYNPQKKNNSFQTVRKPWNNNMKFPPIILQSPENNLEAYRDSFRSCVNVRVVYLMFLPPKNDKKGKKGKKGSKEGKKKKSKSSKNSKKTDSKKGKKSKKGKEKTSSEHNKSNKSETSERSEKIVQKEPKPPTEKILKRVTVAEFNCNLFSITWKDDIHFYWADQSPFGNKAVELYSYLERLKKEAEEQARIEAEKKNEKLAEKLDKKHDKKSKSDKSEKSKNSKSSKKSEKKSKKSKKKKKSKAEPVVSCQVSFGLSRLGQELKDVKSTTDVKEKTNKGKNKKKKNAK
ncbi:leucine-rich repeat-containing protein 43-like [Zophobas morio]|uniref:leucine-rich repeat-containing protein 43-like n=1 Tax=Zophobas morio TaxID=2755281 RepID=UPI003083D17F